jgi:hypothetical protein
MQQKKLTYLIDLPEVLYEYQRLLQPHPFLSQLTQQQLPQPIHQYLHHFSILVPLLKYGLSSVWKKNRSDRYRYRKLIFNKQTKIFNIFFVTFATGIQ